MKEFFTQNGIFITDEQLNLFEKYYQILIEYNSKFNLTAITDKKEVFIKHFVDSVVYVDKLKCGNLLDVGSGGGFPAIPIKILRDDLDVTLLESTGKKCEFLNEVIKFLNLKNIRVINGRAEELSIKPEYRERYSICTARAVARLNVLCEYCLPFVSVGGQFVAFKGNIDQELQEATNAINILGGKVSNVEKYQINGENRALCYIDKILETPKKYPRGRGKERKNPL